MSRSKNVNQVISAVVEAIALYSASELDLATVGCFFEHQEMQFAPRKTQKPMVLLRVDGQPAQSASEKAYNEVGLLEIKRNPYSLVPFR